MGVTVGVGVIAGVLVMVGVRDWVLVGVIVEMRVGARVDVEASVFDGDGVDV